jgi:hypothetical protein
VVDSLTDRPPPHPAHYILQVPESNRPQNLSYDCGVSVVFLSHIRKIAD